MLSRQYIYAQPHGNCIVSLYGLFRCPPASALSATHPCDHAPHLLLRKIMVVPFYHQAKGPFLALLSGLQDALDSCPAMPGATLEASIEDCLRRPSPAAAAWSLGAAGTFVGGVLSLASRSPRSLCQAVVSVLVRFVADKGCALPGGE